MSPTACGAIVAAAAALVAVGCAAYAVALTGRLRLVAALTGQLRQVGWYLEGIGALGAAAIVDAIA
jgi:hypothetical protein